MQPNQTVVPMPAMQLLLRNPPIVKDAEAWHDKTPNPEDIDWHILQQFGLPGMWPAPCKQLRRGLLNTYREDICCSASLEKLTLVFKSEAV